MEKLTKKNSIVAVKHNGIGTIRAYFQTDTAANAYMKENASPNQKLYKEPVDGVYVDESGRYYSVTMHRIYIDLPTRQEVLAKLTSEEKMVLGL